MNPARILKVARWTLPNYTWVVDVDGSVVNDHGEYFDTANPRAQTAIQVKLSREHNWKITQNKHGWTADKYSDDGLISIHNDSLENLLVQLVESL